MSQTKCRRQISNCPSRDPESRPGQRRYYDAELGVTMVRVFQGDHYATSNPNEGLTTTLGSCISVCVRDPAIRYGGMNHFVLPAPGKDNEHDSTHAMRYGSFSIEKLVNMILAEGGNRERLEVKIFGGASVVGGMGNIGFRNADFVEEYLQREQLTVVAQHLRGVFPRTIRYWPATGLVQLRELKNKPAMDIFNQESLGNRETSSFGRVELFDATKADESGASAPVLVQSNET